MINFISDSITILEPNDYIGCQSTFSSITESACGSYIAPSGAIYTTSQTVIDVIPNSANCDSIVTIDLTVHSIDTSVTSSGNILTANASNVAYQWVDCNNGNLPIGGQIHQSFTAVANGSYAVVISENSCTDTSNCFTISTLDVNDVMFEYNVVIYPNPSGGDFAVGFNSDYGNVKVDIKDMQGRSVPHYIEKQPQSANLRIDAPAGFYLLTIQSDRGKGVFKLMKN